MNSPYTLRRVRTAYVLILGKIWMPNAVCSMRIDLSNYDLKNIGDFTRENVEDWLTSHSGDFSQVLDFYAICGDEELQWSNEENEMAYLDTLGEND